MVQFQSDLCFRREKFDRSRVDVRLLEEDFDRTRHALVATPVHLHTNNEQQMKTFGACWVFDFRRSAFPQQSGLDLYESEIHKAVSMLLQHILSNL